eukprot:5161593-Alexandrium_andersonii.AAC.1
MHAWSRAVACTRVPPDTRAGSHGNLSYPGSALATTCSGEPVANGHFCKTMSGVSPANALLCKGLCQRTHTSMSSAEASDPRHPA